MKRARIIMGFVLVLLLFGCSQKQPVDEHSTTSTYFNSEKITTKRAEEESLSKQIAGAEYATKNHDTTYHDGKQKEANTSTVLLTKPKSTVNSFESRTDKYLPSGSSDEVFSYVKKGNMFYIDDKKFAAGQNNYHGIALPKYFLRDGVSVNKIAVNFTYGEKDWLIVSSKGVYGYNMAGGETAVMTAPKGTSSSGGEEYSVPSQDDLLKMQIEGFDNDNQSVFLTDYGEYWWANGYIQSDIKTSEEITIKNRITFKDENMAKMFALELAQKGVKAVDSERDLRLNSYYVKENDVYYLF